VSGQASIWTYVIMAAVVGFAVYRRTRQQPVRPARSVAIAAMIVLLSAVGLVASGRSPQPLALLIAPIALLAGFGLGWLMMGTISFWRDATGQLWMKGGVLYIGIWLATYVLRLAVSSLAGAQPGSLVANPARPEPLALAILSADLLFLSIGLWIARAAALVYRSRKAA
jgi:hypothetical protein